LHASREPVAHLDIVDAKEPNRCGTADSVTEYLTASGSLIGVMRLLNLKLIRKDLDRR